jgi:superfamily I DNA/RNA helicase
MTTVDSAKGYDCPIVILAGADLFWTDKEGRASFYVGATRAKTVLFVTGVKGGDTLADKAKTVGELLATAISASAIPSKAGDRQAPVE